jgi:hypothetical protein
VPGSFRRVDAIVLPRYETGKRLEGGPPVITWILIIAGALLAAAALLVKMRTAFKVALAAVGVLILLVGVSTLLPAKSAPAPAAPAASGPAAGTGTSDADKLHTAVGPRIGETIYSPNPEDTATYLWDRITQAANADPTLKFTEKDTRSAGKVTTSITLTFADGSSLTLKDSPIGPSQGLRLDSVQIARP